MICVIIPLYNKEKSIPRTLDSVLAQTYTDYECLIVDDGSTDQSAQVVRQWVVDNGVVGRFRLVNKENGGASSARNRGIEEAKGEYVAFLDGDDLWEPAYLEELAGLIADYPNAAIYGLGYANVNSGKKQASEVRIEEDFRGIIPDVWGKHSRIYWTSATACPAKLVQQTLFDENLTHGEDIDVWYRLMLQGECVFYNKTLAYYVQDSENRAMSDTPAINKHLVSVIARYTDARTHNKEFCRAFDTQMIYFLYPYLFDKQYKAEAKRLAKMLDYKQLKGSLKFRIDFPYLYRLYLNVKRIWTK